MGSLNKLFSIACVLFFIGLTYCSPFDPKNAEPFVVSHNLIQCENVNYDYPPAYTYLFTREAKFLQTRREILTWPENGLNFNPIYCIKIIDQITNGKGGYVEVIAGGLRKNFIEIQFTSQFNKRMSFHIEIYTHMYNM